MSDTYQFALPLVQAAQSQKHVTINEALARLDAVAQLRVLTDDLVNPPSTAANGQAYVVGSGATGDWVGQDGSVAIFSNGGWEYLAPKFGWRALNVALNSEIMFDGVAWVRHAKMVSIGGAANLRRIIEVDHTLSFAPISAIENIIPSHSRVTGVTARVISPITGAGVASWSLGVAGSPDKYGSALGLPLNSYGVGVSGPETYWTDTSLEITANAGSFDGGVVRLAVHLEELQPPRAV